MKVITIRQPWANLVALSLKTIETRNWKTKYRGPIAIHAGKTVDNMAVEYIEKYHNFAAQVVPVGAIIAVSFIVDIIEYKSQKQWLNDDNLHLCGFLRSTKYGLIFGETRIVDPIPCHGMPGLFEVEI